MGQCGPHSNFARGDLGQDLQDRDVPHTPLARYLVSHPEHPGDMTVLVIYRDPGPGNHAYRTRQVIVSPHGSADPGVTDDQIVFGAEDIRAQQLFKRALLTASTRGADHSGQCARTSEHRSEEHTS